MNVGIVVAGGSGERFGREGGKQLAPLAGRPMLYWTLAAFQVAASVDTVVVTFDPDRVDALRGELAVWGLTKVAAVVPGGQTRQESVRAGLEAVPEDATLIMVHDGARPLITPADIDACAAALGDTDGAVLGRPAVDTIKRVRAEGTVDETVDRRALWQAETPQAFPAEILRRAHLQALEKGLEATDDAMLVEASGGTVRMVRASGPNLKVTLPDDLALAAAILAERGPRVTMRVGLGVDMHRFVQGRPLILGGVDIPHPLGLLGHSDADCLVHAVMDAILGAMGEGDIGAHFPDLDERYRGASSLEMLEEVGAMMARKRFSLVNLDAVVMIERPKMAPYRDEMRQHMANALGVDVAQVHVKATTTEELDAVGRGEGVMAHAVALLERG